MKLINDSFVGRLSNMTLVNTEQGAFKELTFTHVSDESEQVFLEGFDEEFQSRIEKHLRDPEWDNIKFSTRINDLSIEFDAAQDGSGALKFVADLKEIKITQKSDSSFKYDVKFRKKSEDLDKHLENYHKHKEYDENDKMVFVLFDIEISNK